MSAWEAVIGWSVHRIFLSVFAHDCGSVCLLRADLVLLCVRMCFCACECQVDVSLMQELIALGQESLAAFEDPTLAAQAQAHSSSSSSSHTHVNSRARHNAPSTFSDSESCKQPPKPPSAAAAAMGDAEVSGGSKSAVAGVSTVGQWVMEEASGESSCVMVGRGRERQGGCEAAGGAARDLSINGSPHSDACGEREREDGYTEGRRGRVKRECAVVGALLSTHCCQFVAVSECSECLVVNALFSMCCCQCVAINDCFECLVLNALLSMCCCHCIVVHAGHSCSQRSSSLCISRELLRLSLFLCLPVPLSLTGAAAAGSLSLTLRLSAAFTAQH